MLLVYPQLWETLALLFILYRFVYVWDTTSRRILYKLPGHAGSINEVAFHPDEPISKFVLTMGEEKLGESPERGPENRGRAGCLVFCECP